MNMLTTISPSETLTYMKSSLSAARCDTCVQLCVMKRPLFDSASRSAATGWQHRRSVQRNLGRAGQHERGGPLGLVHLVQAKQQVQLGDGPEPLLIHRPREQEVRGH